MKFNKSKCQILPLGWSKTQHKCKWGEDQLESSPAERDLEVSSGPWQPGGQTPSQGASNSTTI